MPAAKCQLRIDELASLVHPRDAHIKIFAMLNAYLDESGIHDGAPVCVIAGYFAGRGQWRKFERDWRDELMRFEVPLCEFHAQDLIKRRGFFEKWSESKHDGFLNVLADVIGRYKIHPIARGVIVEDFFSFTYNQRRFFTGAVLDRGRLRTSGCPEKPYFFAFSHCVRLVAGYAPVGGKAHFFFGVDRPFAEYALTLWKTLQSEWVSHPYRERLGDLGISRASETPQLQAADFLSYLLYKDIPQRKAENTWRTAPPPLIKKCIARLQGGVDDIACYDRNSFEHLLQKSYADQGHWDKEVLED